MKNSSGGDQGVVGWWVYGLHCLAITQPIGGMIVMHVLNVNSKAQMTSN